MSNYQTDFLNALSITSQSLSGLMRDIREPDFQDKLRMQEESTKRINQQSQDFAMERMDVGQQYQLEQMDASQQDALERISQQGITQLQNTKEIEQFRSTLGREDAKFYDDFRRQSAIEDQNAQFDYMSKNYKKIAKLENKITAFSSNQGYKTRKGKLIPNFIYDKSGGYIKLGKVGTDRLGQNLDKSRYEFETGLQLGRQGEFFQQQQDFKAVNDAIATAANVTPEFKQEYDETTSGLNAYYSNLDMSDPAQMLAAQKMFAMANQGLAAQMIVDNQKMSAMSQVLQANKTPDFSLEDVLLSADRAVPKDRMFRRSPDNRMELADARKNAYSSSLGLATLQAQYALQDKFGGMNRSRQKEALKDLIEAKSLAERLMNESKYGSTSKENIDKHKQYYGESIKMLNTWIQALQK